jgi:hypothetical protein
MYYKSLEAEKVTFFGADRKENFREKKVLIFFVIDLEVDRHTYRPRHSILVGPFHVHFL